MSSPTLFSYLSLEEGLAICKLAEGKKPNRAVEVLKAVAYPLAGMAAGTVGAFGAGLLADRISQKLMGHPIPISYLNAVAPAVGALSGLAFGMYKSQEMEDIRRAIEGDSDKPGSGK